MEVHRDIAGTHQHASRNAGDLRHTYEAPGANRHVFDYMHTLRQAQRKPRNLSNNASAPALLTADLLHRPVQSNEHVEPYHSGSKTVGRYHNFATAAHMITHLTRVSSGSAEMLDWQLNLRGGTHQRAEEKWRRNFTRPQQSFDMMAENCSRNNEAYQTSNNTPQDRRPDRRTGAIPCETIREDPISFKRWPGCEGAQVGQWRHLIEDRRYGHKSRRQIQMEVTMREHPDDTNGARVNDQRNDGCIVEMLGKKRWYGNRPSSELARHPMEGGDPKLHHLNCLRPLPEADEGNRAVRKGKQKRLDADVPDVHVTKAALLQH